MRMTIGKKLFLGSILIILLVLAVGIYGLNASKEIAASFEGGEEHFRSIVSAATEASSYAKRAEGHLMLYVTLHDEADRENFFIQHTSLLEQVVILDERAKFTEARVILDNIKSNTDELVIAGNSLLEAYDEDMAKTGVFETEKYEELILALHDAASAIRRDGIELADFETDFLNKQAAITAATEVSSYVKRAEGHLMLYVTLHDEVDREKFFNRHASLLEQIAILDERVKVPEAIMILDNIKSNTDELVAAGNSLLEAYDEEMARTGVFETEKHKELILALHNTAAAIQNDGIELAKYNIHLESELKNTAVQNAASIQRNIIIVMVCLIVFALGLAYLISISITKPIKELKDAAIMISKGDLTRKARIKAKDEIGELANSFNLMTDKIQERNEQLEATNEELRKAQNELERRVKERTEELVKANEELQAEVTQRKQAEEALRESEEKYSSLVEHGNDGIVILQNGVVKYANSKMVEMLGYSLEEAIGKPFIDFVSQEYRELVADNYRKRMVGEEAPTTYEFDITAKDGSIISAEVNASVLEYEKKTADMAIIRDITGRKRAREALRESEEKFSKAFHSSPNAMAITTLKDGIFIDVNDGFTHGNGYTREEVIGNSSKELNIWVKLEERDRILQKLRKDGRVVNEVYSARTKSGEIRTMHFSAEPINVAGEACIIAVTTDITELNKREQLQRDENYVLTLLGQGAELSELLDAIVRLGEDHDTSIKGSVLLFDPEREWLVQASAPSLPDDYKELMKDGLPIGPDMGSCGTAAYLKERVIVTDIENSPLFKPFEEVVKRSINNGLLSCWSQPIISSNGELLGTIANYGNKVGEPDADNLRVLEWSARIAAIAIERKRAEEALANEAMRRRILIEQSLDGIVILDVNSKVYEANQQFAEMLGYSSEEVRELHTWDWDTQWTREELLEMGRNVDETGYHLETYWQRKDGTSIDVEISINGAVCAGQKLIFCVCRDITERKQMEQAMRESEEKFSKAFSASPDIISIVSLEDNRFIDVNESFTHYTGYTREEMVGHTTAEVSIWAEAEERERILGMLKEKGKVSYEEIHTRTKSGEIRTGLYSSEIIHIGGELCSITVLMDITERKQAEEALRINEERFRLIADNATDMISRIQMAPTIRTDYVSPSCFRLTGYKQEEFYADPNLGLEIIHPDDREFLNDHVMSGNKENQKPITIRMIRKDSRRIWIEQTHAMISNEQGEPLAIHLIARDITARKEAEEALRESEEKFSKAFRSSPNTIAITTVKDGRFIEVNDSFTVITGYTREEAIGHSSNEISIWAKAADRDRMLKVLKHKGRVYNEEFDFRIKSGEIRTWLFSAERIDIGGEPCIISMTIDITELKRMQAALSESEEFSTSLLENSPNPVLVINPDTSVRYVNPAFNNLTGFTSDEIAGRKAPYPWWPEEARAEIGASLEETLARGGRSREHVFQKKNGERFWVAINSASVMYKGKPKYLLINWVDITGRKQAEEKLRLLSSVTEQVSDSIIVTDTDFRITYMNKAARELLGYSIEEVLGKDLGCFDTKPLTKSQEQGVSQTVSSGKIWDGTMLKRRKDGSTFLAECRLCPLLDNQGQVSLFIDIERDITERKRAEEALRESEEKFFKAFHSSPDAIAITSRKDDRFIEVNDSFTRITGYKRNEVIGRNSLELNTWANEDELQKIMRKINKQSSVHNEERAFRTKAGEIRAGLFSVENINIGGEPCLLSVTTDINERKQAEEKLKQALFNLEQSSAQLAATNKELEAFSYSVSHDLRSPLRSIDGFSQALLEDYQVQLDENGQNYLRRLRGASQKMGELIDGILKLSRLTRSEMHKKKVNLSKMVEEITARLHENQPERHTEFVISKGLSDMGDPQLLRALFENLLGNAWKFTSKCERARIEFGTTQNGGKKTYFINDNGAGFDMTYAEKLFGAFQRLHEAGEYPGTGIGLATVQRIINRHGGSIWAEGAVGKGATFYFTLN
jgi:PAS domain S-box-containing protein